VHAAITIVKQDGPLGLWAGAAPTVMRNGTNQMCLFWAKNQFDRLFFDKIEGDGRQLAPWQSMMSGFSAACIGPFATGPFDVVKARACLPSPRCCCACERSCQGQGPRGACRCCPACIKPASAVQTVGRAGVKASCSLLRLCMMWASERAEARDAIHAQWCVQSSRACIPSAQS